VSRLTIAQRLWLGLGLIVALFALADLVSLRAANRVDVTLETLVSSGDERRGASSSMRSELAAIVRAVQTYVREKGPEQRTAVNKSEKAFEQALVSYNSAASAERGRALGLQLNKTYARLKRKTREVMRLADARALARNALAAHQARIEGLLSATPVVAVPARQSASIQRPFQIKEVESALRAAALDLDVRTQAVTAGLILPKSTG